VALTRLEMKDGLDYTIRPCGTRDELAACVKLQRAIWGYAEHEVYPLRLFLTLTKIGGHVLGAFTPDHNAVGFAASMPAWREGRRYYHSLSLGVLPGHENRGLGRALKLRQREEALRAGIDRIEWTYDPMQAKNAFFNIERLGTIAHRYLPDHYGKVESRLQQGLPSDRLLAEWRLKSLRTQRALAGKTPRSGKTSPAAEVVIPTDFSSTAAARPEEAGVRQLAVRASLEKYFARGLAITGFTIEGGTGRYLLDPYDLQTRPRNKVR
jgi:predicted GNAT superfamily acetyltransferase